MRAARLAETVMGGGDYGEGAALMWGRAVEARGWRPAG